MATDLKIAESWLKETDAELLSFSVNSLTGDEQITRGWPAEKIPDAKRNICKQYLAQKTSVSNKGKTCHTVDDPQCDREVFDGRWRHVNEGFQIARQKEYLTQTIRKGYATAISWDEARLVEGKTTKGQAREKFRTICWINCAPTSVEVMAASLSDATYANKKVSGQTLSGTWYNIYVAPSLDQEGSGVVTLYLGIPQVVKEGIVTLWNQKFKEWTYIYEGYTETQADALIVIINAATPTAGWTYNAQPKPAGEGLWNVIITKRQIQKQTITEYDAAKAEGFVETAEGVLGTTNAAELPIGDTAVGETRHRTVNRNPDGSSDIRKGVRTAQEQTITEYDAAKAGTHHEARQAVLNTTDSAKLPIATTAGEIQNRAVSKKDDGSMDIHKDRRIADDIETAEYDDDYFILRESADHTAKSSALARETVVEGEAVRIINSATEYPSRYRTKRTKEVPQHRTMAEHVIRYSERQTDYITKEFHDSNSPTIEDKTADGQETAILSHDLDKFQRHTFSKLRSVKKFPISDADNVTGISWTIYGDLETISVQTAYWTSSMSSSDPPLYYIEYNYVYQTEYNHTMKYFKTAKEAADWCDQTNTVVLADDPNADGFSSGLKTKHEENYQSHFGKTGEFEWEAVRVIPTHSLRYTYHYPEPESE